MAEKAGRPGAQQRPAGENAGEFSDSSEEEHVEPDELYDEGEDDANEAWINRHYRKEATRQGKTQGPPTDAVLNCPCCFTTLCVDCQRHTRYKNQYRAMFTVNCTVKPHVRVSSGTPTPPPTASETRAEAEAKAKAKEEGEEELHPVVCATCGTEVGVQDEDEVVHFHNVLAS